MSNTVYFLHNYLVSGLREIGLSVERTVIIGMPIEHQVFCKVCAPVFKMCLIESLLCARQWANVLVKAFLNARRGISPELAHEGQGWKWRDLLWREEQEAECNWVS